MLQLPRRFRIDVILQTLPNAANRLPRENIFAKREMDELWSSELAAEFGLPDGWYVYRQLKMKGGKETYVTRFRNGLSGKVLKTASEVEGVLGYKPQFPKPRNVPVPLRVGSFNIGVDQNMLTKDEMDEMAREFTLLVKPPGQGRGFAGKGKVAR